MPAYQRQYVEEMLQKLRKKAHDAIHADQPAPLLDAYQQCIDFWVEALKTPYDTDQPQTWGSYVVMRASHHPSTDEWTNIGVMVYDKDGKQIWAKMGPFDRAIARGDLTAHTAKGCDQRHKAYESIEQVKRALESLGHAMSSIQITEPRATAIDPECCWSIYQSFVLGVD